ncbi:MAG: hypothetical protein IIA14_12085, partial [SAR324 cluster bacterium]|nr:hypothetical protein [SAR324 cluster bacterium]
MDCGGPFPVVVYAHGHRTPTEVLCSWSDPGPVHQDYLQAEEILTRLATSGMIVISPDVSCGEFNIGRASVMLNALAYLRDEHGSSGSVLEGGVDMRRIGLAGHSRGGGGAIFAANEIQNSF